MSDADVLVKWAARLEWAATWAGHASNFNKSEDFQCMNDLAAEVRALRERLAELETEKRLASDWECANCGRMNPGTMPYCPCREET